MSDAAASQKVDSPMCAPGHILSYQGSNVECIVRIFTPMREGGEPSTEPEGNIHWIWAFAVLLQFAIGCQEAFRAEFFGIWEI
jgi:hypothetical protein